MYLIDVPPPTISGLLHMGHVFSYCHMDFIARFYYKSRKILYPSCYDCNGLPTEKLANSKGIFDKDEIIKFSRETWKDYKKLFNDIGMSYSGDKEVITHHYNTFDDNAIALAKMSFDDLQDKGLAYKKETEYFYCPKTKVSVSQNELTDDGRYERSGELVELRTGEGWFISVLDQLPEIRAAIDKIKWTPDVFRLRLHAWLDELKYDWSISRERNFGIHIPGEAENIVFDTWFISSLSPQLSMSALTDRASLDCPVFNVRFQAHDIIRTWALFTIIKSLYHNGQIPWENIVISGHALDKNGAKISKSAGNFVPPQTYIDRYGAYGLRYWAAHNQVGTDSKTDENLMNKGKKLINKIYNAQRFIESKEYCQFDCVTQSEYWLEWNECSQKINFELIKFNWANAIQLLTDFFWHRFCDVFIEESKKKNDGDTYYALSEVMDDIISYYDIFFPRLRTHLKELKNAKKE